MAGISCEIESKSDFLTGMYLIAHIAENDLDENALRTIQEDCPDFILPFNYKYVNGQVEFTYKVGALCKLQYFYGEISHGEYVAFWRSLLNPLLQCRDWFMNPCSFVLCDDYLYYDKNKQTVVYVYIPSKAGCSGYEAFSEMATQVAKGMNVSDPALENKVLRGIINDFNPGDFLKMLLEHVKQSEKEAPEQREEDSCEDAPDVHNAQVQEGANAQAAHDCPSSIHEDIPSGRLPVPLRNKEPDGVKLFSGRGKKGSKAKHNGFKNTIPNEAYIQAVQKEPCCKDITQETRAVPLATGLRCIGRAQFPQTIEVKIADGEVFTIGRHDVSAGKKRSSFEFDAKTKAVSRRHAAIELGSRAYRIIDLASSAGTFLNDKKLPPNTPAILKPGCRVSFGNMGADYVWEVS